VQRKVEGQEITMTEAPEGGGAQVIDLMEALRASLERKPKAKDTLSAAKGTTDARKPPKRAAAAEAPAPVARKGAKSKA
jgi:DNA end-binding protein Ku